MISKKKTIQIFFTENEVLLSNLERVIDIQHYSPFIHQFRESVIQVVMLSLEGHKANPTELFQAVVQQNVRKWQAPGRRAEK